MIELRNLNQDQIKEMIPDTPILVGYRGSIAHGMYVLPTEPTSIDDKDLMSVCIPPLKYYFGFGQCEFGGRGVKEAKIGEWDSVAYEFKKFVHLLYNSNPNVLSILWLNKQYYVHVDPLGERLIEARLLFVSKKIYHSFTGYAHDQIHRMTHQAFEGYMGEKRKTLVEKFGYDTKNAAHCIRLLRMGIEFLNEGVLYVDRSGKDGQQLLEIKRGEWKLDQIKEEAARLFKRAEEAYDRSTLPSEPNKDAVSSFVVETLVNHFRSQIVT